MNHPLALTFRRTRRIGACAPRPGAAFTLLLLILLLMPAVLAGCGKLLDPGPPPTRMQIKPALPPRMTEKPLDRQLVVALPLAGRDIDTDAVALVFNGREIRYLAGTRWTTAVPQLVQRGIIDALEATNGLRGVADESAGIAARAKLLCDIKQFALVYPGPDAAPTAVFTAALRLIDLDSGKVMGVKTVAISSPAGGKDNAALVSAAEIALGKGLAEVAPWVIESMRSMR